MPKLKTHKGLKKRIKITGTGKIKRHKAGKSHLLAKKSAKRKRKLSKPTLVKGGQAKLVRRLVG